MVALIFVLFVVLLLIGMALPGAIGLATIYGFDVCGLNFNMIWSGMIRQMNSFSNLAIPFFILAGNLMSKGSIAQELLNVCQAFAGKKKLSIGITTIVVCAFFAALSGSSVATVAAIGPITFPLMIAMGYDKAWAAAIIASGAIVGPIIPPSVSLVVYGVATNESVSNLFMAGVIPGLLLSLSFIIVLMITNKKNIDAETNRKMQESVPDYTLIQKLKIIWHAKWALLMPVIVLGGIYGGFYTPTEASIIAVDYVLLLGLLQKTLKLSDLKQSLFGMFKSIGGLMLILSVAQAFGYVVALNQIPDKIVAFMSGINSQIIILLIINLILLIVGCFMEALAAIVIFTPILAPLAISAGLTNLQFGIVMCVNLVIGTITPPFGLDLFVASGLTKVPVNEIVRKTVPFIISSVVVLMLITYLPQIIDFLPRLLHAI